MKNFSKWQFDNSRIILLRYFPLRNLAIGVASVRWSISIDTRAKRRLKVS